MRNAVLVNRADVTCAYQDEWRVVIALRTGIVLQLEFGSEIEAEDAVRNLSGQLGNYLLRPEKVTRESDD
ncbi:MAG: hypothetical protein KBA03_03705 [Anaerolineaceae bacterium]|nr:hypothetical protein [Anaerolineaceae bacterium]